MGGGAAAGETLKAFSPSNPLCAEKKKGKKGAGRAQNVQLKESRILGGLGLEL
jgi:hypothetical protein